MNNSEYGKSFYDYLIKYGELNSLKSLCNVQRTNERRSIAPFDMGYVNIFIYTGEDYRPLNNAIVTVYVRRNPEIELPILRMITTINPILIQLPIAYNPETLIRGPEYFFSTYNISIDADGYYPVKILNVRMFPRVSTSFYVKMTEISDDKYESKYENVIYIPPHPRDKVLYED